MSSQIKLIIKKENERHCNTLHKNYAVHTMVIKKQTTLASAVAAQSEWTKNEGFTDWGVMDYFQNVPFLKLSFCFWILMLSFLHISQTPPFPGWQPSMLCYRRVSFPFLSSQQSRKWIMKMGVQITSWNCYIRNNIFLLKKRQEDWIIAELVLIPEEECNFLFSERYLPWTTTHFMSYSKRVWMKYF